MYTLTNGTPIALTLCVDRCAEIIDRGEKPAIEDFGNTMDTLIEKFVGGIVDGKRDILYMLSCIHRWDNELIKETAEKILSSFSPSAFDTVQKLSFISVGSGIYTMHPTVRNVLYEICGKRFSVIKERTEKILTEYYQRKLMGRDEFSPGFENDLFLYARYATAQGTEDIAALYVEKLRKYSKRLVDCEKLSTATELVELFWHDVESFPDSENKMILASDYAYVLKAKGQYEKACHLFKFVNNWNIEFLGDDHPSTLISMDNIATTYNELGRYEDALKLHEEVLAKRRKSLGEDHSSTLISMSNLATTYMHLGRNEDALKLLEEVLAKRRESLGEDHPDIFTIMNNLASAYGYLGRYEDAIKLLEEVLAKRRKSLGEDHSSTLISMSNLATTYMHLGRNEDAIKLLEEVLAKRRESLGEDHPYTLAAKNNLAATFLKLGRYNHALRLQKEVLSKMRELFGENHPNTKVSKDNLAFTCSCIDRQNDSSKLKASSYAKKDVEDKSEKK